MQHSGALNSGNTSRHSHDTNTKLKKCISQNQTLPSSSLICWLFLQVPSGLWLGHSFPSLKQRSLPGMDSPAGVVIVLCSVLSPAPCSRALSCMGLPEQMTLGSPLCISGDHQGRKLECSTRRSYFSDGQSGDYFY